MATVSPAPAVRRPVVPRWLVEFVGDLGDLAAFGGEVFRWAVRRPGRMPGRKPPYLRRFSAVSFGSITTEV